MILAAEKKATSYSESGEEKRKAVVVKDGRSNRNDGARGGYLQDAQVQHASGDEELRCSHGALRLQEAV